MDERATVLLPSSYDLKSHSDPTVAAYGVKYSESVVMSPDGEQTLVLLIGEQKDRCADAVLIWRRRVGDHVTDKQAIKVEEICLAQVVGATDVASAIRAVEEAAVIAGWARRPERQEGKPAE